MTDYKPSPIDFVREQVALYEATDGAEGNTIEGRPVVIITSKGAKSGAVRKNPVMRVEHDGSYAAVASKGGAPEHPSWYHNFVAHPQVELQDGATKRTYDTRIITGDERAQWWQRAVEVWPAYAEYATKTDREIPVFLLTPVE